MEPIYQQTFTVNDSQVDRFGYLRPAAMLWFAQEVAGDHFALLSMDYDSLSRRGLFWAVTRHRVQINRLPRLGETIRIETWPMPTTRVAFPRSLVAYDEQGNELFRSISIWVLMDTNTRNMILPGKSGISVPGTLRGLELATPTGLVAREFADSRERAVCFTDLDRNGHMNNTRYLDWIADLLPSAFHQNHRVKEFTVCYLSEAKEGEVLTMHWGLQNDNTLQVDAYRQGEEKQERVVSARLLFD